MNLWDFEEGEHKPPSEWKRKGKPEWPDMIRVAFPNRSAAWRFASEVLSQLEHEDDGCTGASIVLFGELNKGSDE